jgi:hypothetical protein
MIVNASLPPTQALRIVPRVVPSAFWCLCRRSLATSVPAKVVGLVDRAKWLPLWPTDFGGTAANAEATDGDGDENSSREQSPTL